MNPHSDGVTSNAKLRKTWHKPNLVEYGPIAKVSKSGVESGDIKETVAIYTSVDI